MKFARFLVPAVLALGLLVSRPADASVRVNLGGDYWAEHSALFHLTLGADTRLAGPLSIGARFGALLATEGNTFGVPIDAVLRANFDQLYIEGIAGPWVFFSGDVFRGHGALGFGIQGSGVSFGLEVGYLAPSPHVGTRLGFRF